MQPHGPDSRASWTPQAFLRINSRAVACRVRWDRLGANETEEDVKMRRVSFELFRIFLSLWRFSVERENFNRSRPFSQVFLSFASDYVSMSLKKMAIV